MDEAPRIWKSPDAKFYREEKRIIMRHLDPFYTAGFMTMFLFATFRISGSRWFARFRDEFFVSSRAASKASNTKPTQEWKSFLDRQVDERQKMESELLQLPIDLFLSALCGISSILWLSKPKEILRDLSELPLVSGNSVVHRYACHEFETAYHQLDKDVFEQNVDDNLLRSFHTFVENCRIRSEFIRSQEREGANTPEVIPYPGIRVGSR